MTDIPLQAHPRRRPGTPSLASTLSRAGLLSLLYLAHATADDTGTAIDFDRFERPGSPNSALIGPTAGPPRRPDAEAPVFAIPAQDLAAHWQTVVQAQPRTRIRSVSADDLQVEAEQRSALFGFVDDISFRAIALDAGRATFVAYSRSRVGYWDLGVNRRRLHDWIDALQRRVAAGGEA